MTLSIKIWEIAEFYRCSIFDISTNEDVWVSAKSMDKEYLTNSLISLGFHSRDVCDAFDQAEGKSVNTPHPLINHNGNA